VTDWAKVVVAENNPMSDEIPFLIREPLSRAFGISNENWQQPTEFTARVDLTCGFEMKRLTLLIRFVAPSKNGGV
jgi:hypothetical protein